MKFTLIRLSFLLCCCLLLGQNRLVAQEIVNLPKNHKNVLIPFEYVNNFIIVKIRLEGLMTLNFVLDTGAEQTIITKRQVTDLLKINYNKKYTFYGADMSRELHAYLARFVNFNIGELYFTNQPIFVLEEDYLQLENFVGIDIHGILSFSHFYKLLVQLNYKTKTLKLYERKHLDQLVQSYQQLPIRVKDNRPYLHTDIVLQNKDTAQVQLLIDSGSSLGLVLHNYTHPKIKLPEHHVKGKIGVGMGGKVEGYLGRIHRLNIKPYQLYNLLTQFQVVPHTADTASLDGRHGFIGNLILDRFTMVFDFVGKHVYLKPLKKLDLSFPVDLSGLVLYATGRNLRQYVVETVISTSPAEEVGIQKDDLLLKINGLPTKLFSLNTISKKMTKARKKPLKLMLKRNGQKIKRLLYLREYI